eukprot:1998931-Amphidinium_carterae.1
MAAEVGFIGDNHHDRIQAWYHYRRLVDASCMPPQQLWLRLLSWTRVLLATRLSRHILTAE